MKISSLSVYAAASTPKISANGKTEASSFAALMAGQSATAARAPETLRAEEPQVERSSASLAFEEWMSKSEAEKLREALLQKMGLTEDALEAMDPEERAIVEERIAREIVAEVQRQVEEKTYNPVGLV